MMRRFLFVPLVLLLTAPIAVAQITVPYPTFTSGTVISPAEVNSNFSTLGTTALNRTGGTMTGVLKTADGAVGAPSVAFANEPTTGIYRPGAGQIAIARLGVQALLINSSGLSVGTIAAGTWQGSVIAPAYLGTGTPSAATFLDGTGAWATPGFGTGSVTSVGLSLPAMFTVSGSPVTTAGTLSATLATQAANVVFAGPTSGAAAAPTWRSLVAADLPTITTLGTIVTGVWHGTAIDQAYLGTITSLGTVTTGTWQGTVVAPAYLGSGTPSATTWLRGDGAWTGLGTTTASTYYPTVWNSVAGQFETKTDGIDSTYSSTPWCVSDATFEKGLVTVFTLAACSPPGASPVELLALIRGLQGEIARLQAQTRDR